LGKSGAKVVKKSTYFHIDFPFALLYDIVAKIRIPVWEIPEGITFNERGI